MARLLRWKVSTARIGNKPNVSEPYHSHCGNFPWISERSGEIKIQWKLDWIVNNFWKWVGYYPLYLILDGALVRTQEFSCLPLFSAPELLSSVLLVVKTLTSPRHCVHSTQIQFKRSKTRHLSQQFSIKKGYLFTNTFENIPIEKTSEIWLLPRIDFWDESKIRTFTRKVFLVHRFFINSSTMKLVDSYFLCQM